MLFFFDKVVSKGLTFNNILLMAYYSAVSPCNFELFTWFSRHKMMNMPLVNSAAKAYDEPSVFNI